MSAENKALVRRFFEEVFNQGNLDLTDEMYDPGYIDHNRPPGLPPGVAGLKALVGMYRAAFPDVRMKIEDQISEGDKVVTRWTATGTHQGDLMGIPATGKVATVTGIDITRIVGNKIVENWNQFDQMGMMQQLGVIPADEG